MGGVIEIDFVTVFPMVIGDASAGVTDGDGDDGIEGGAGVGSEREEVLADLGFRERDKIFLHDCLGSHRQGGQGKR